MKRPQKQTAKVKIKQTINYKATNDPCCHIEVSSTNNSGDFVVGNTWTTSQNSIYVLNDGEEYNTWSSQTYLKDVQKLEQQIKIASKQLSQTFPEPDIFIENEEDNQIPRRSVDRFTDFLKD